ncbi:neuropeptide FF receptor 1 like 3 [Aplochiton taeniatus]
MDDLLELTTVYTTFDHLPSFTYTDLSNLTNSSHFSGYSVTLSPYYQHSLVIAVSFTIAYLFIFLLCMVGNTLVCAIVVRNRHMRTITNLFIFNLAISDLLVGIFCIPTTLVDNLITGWPFSDAMCKLSGLVQGISVCASVFTLVAIAMHRFRCIVFPVKPKITLFAAKVTLALVWALALVIILPSAVMLTVTQEPGHFMATSDNRTVPLYSCYETWPDPEMRKVYTVVLFTMIYLVPLVLIMIMYGCIGAKLYSTVVLLSGMEGPGAVPIAKPHISQRKFKVIKMLIMVALLFMLSWLPLWTLMLITDYARPEGDQLDLLTGYIFPFSHWLAFSNSSVNPIIYGYFNENFKRGFQAACSSISYCRVEPQGGGLSQPMPGSKVRTLQDTALSANPGTLGVRNRNHTGTSDPTGCVCLEMERRRDEASAETKASRAEGGSGGLSIKLSLNLEDGDRVAPSGAFVCRAWEL